MTEFRDRHNPNDQLGKVAPDHGAELFRRLSRACDGFSGDAVENAAMNLLINAMRQKHATVRAAGDGFDQLVVRAKEVLLSQHYDALGNRRRNTFAFSQTIVMPPGPKLS